jgi:transposase
VRKQRAVLTEGVLRFQVRDHGATITKQQFDAMDYRSKAPFASRLFANQATTDGYSASVLLTRPKLEHEQKQEMSRPTKKPRRGKHSTSDDDEWCALPLDYEVDMVIGIDPGMRRLCTAVREGVVMLPHGLLENWIRKKRSRRRRQRRRCKKRRRDRAQGVRCAESTLAHAKSAVRSSR